MTQYEVIIMTRTTYVVKCECEEEAAEKVEQLYKKTLYITDPQVQKTSHEIVDIEVDTV